MNENDRFAIVLAEFVYGPGTWDQIDPGVQFNYLLDAAAILEEYPFLLADKDNRS